MAPSKTEELGGELRMFVIEERANWLVSRAVKANDFPSGWWAGGSSPGRSKPVNGGCYQALLPNFMVKLNS